MQERCVEPSAVSVKCSVWWLKVVMKGIGKVARECWLGRVQCVALVEVSLVRS